MDVYNYKEADCIGQAYLLCELMRAADIPAVVAFGSGGNMTVLRHTDVLTKNYNGYDLVDHAWVYYYDNGEWKIADTALNHHLTSSDEIIKWYYPFCVDGLAVYSEYYTPLVSISNRVACKNTLSEYIVDMERFKCGNHNIFISPEHVFLYWNSEYKYQVESNEVLKGVFGEKGWVYFDKTFDNISYLKNNGYLKSYETLVENGKEYWFAQSGRTFDLTGYGNGYYLGMPVFKVGDEFEIKPVRLNDKDFHYTYTIVSQFNYLDYGAENGVVEIDENGKVKVIGIGDAHIELYDSNSYTYFFDLITVDPAPYKNINLKSTVNGNSVTLSWDKFEGVKKYIIKQKRGDIWYDIKTVMGDSNTVEISDLELNSKYTFSLSVCEPYAGYRVECDDVVEVEIIECKHEARDAFVNNLYETLLGREAEEEGLREWSDKLESGELSSAEIVYSVVGSPEYIQKGYTNEEMVEMMYQTMLGRASDLEGKKYWVERLEAGMTIKTIVNGFSGSPEFTGICEDFGIEAGSIELTETRDQNFGLTSFVTRMYSEALERRYDEGGVNDWTNRYLTGTAKVSDIAFGFIFSPEFVGKNLSNSDYVDTLYRTFFNREPDEGGKADWMNKLASGTAREDVLNGFVGSQECINLVATFGI